MGLSLLADAAPSGVLPALIGAVATIAVGLLALAGVRWTARQQGRLAENERKLSLFEEQDRLLEQNRREADRAFEDRERMRTERDLIAADRDQWRHRAVTAEKQVVDWIEKREKP